jgi:glycosyltransferase involved in cell wall biosynthesis
VGGGNQRPFKLLAEESDCISNIDFTGFLPTQKDLFEYVKSSKVILAPPLVERLSCTIREAMVLQVPIVAYATGAIPSINEKEENILIVDTGDYRRMASETMKLLQNEERGIQLSEKAFIFYNQNFSLEVSVNLFMSAYKNILNKSQY